MNNSSLRDSSGFSLLQLLIGLAIGTLIYLGVGQLGAFSTSQYYLTVEENTAEQSLLMASYYLKLFLGQAVETVCSSSVPATSALGSPVTLALNPSVPPYIGQGVVDCFLVHPLPAPIPGNPQAIGVFNREVGGVTSLAPGNYPMSQFEGAGIYFLPPSGTSSGVLYFAKALAGSRNVNLANAISLDHFVDVQIPTPAQISPAGRLESLTLQLTARYMLTQTSSPNYTPGPPPGSPPSKDITLTINVGLRDNWLGVSHSTGYSGMSERLHGGLYYFRTIIPTLVQQ